MLLILLACSRPDPAAPSSVTRWTLDNGARIVVQTTLDGDELVAAWSESRTSFPSEADAAATMLALAGGNAVPTAETTRSYRTPFSDGYLLPLGVSAGLEWGEAEMTCRARAWGTIGCAADIAGRFLHPVAVPAGPGVWSDDPRIDPVQEVSSRRWGTRVSAGALHAARAAWTSEDATARHRAQFGDAGQFVFAFVGPLPAWVLKPAIDATIGALPGTPTDVHVDAAPPLPPTGPAVVPPGVDGSLLRTWATPCGVDAADIVAFRAVATAATDAVGHRGLVDAVRSGGVCSLTVAGHPDGRAAIHAALASLQAGDLEAFRNRIGRPPRSGDSLAWLQRLHDVEIHGAPADWVAQEEREAARFDQAALDRASARFLDPGNLSEAFIADSDSR